jgi:hypothetical protein
MTSKLCEIPIATIIDIGSGGNNFHTNHRLFERRIP